MEPQDELAAFVSLYKSLDQWMDENDDESQQINDLQDEKIYWQATYDAVIAMGDRLAQQAQPEMQLQIKNQCTRLSDRWQRIGKSPMRIVVDLNTGSQMSEPPPPPGPLKRYVSKVSIGTSLESETLSSQPMNTQTKSHEDSLLYSPTSDGTKTDGNSSDATVDADDEEPCLFESLEIYKMSVQSVIERYGQSDYEMERLVQECRDELERDQQLDQEQRFLRFHAVGKIPGPLERMRKVCVDADRLSQYPAGDEFQETFRQFRIKLADYEVKWFDIVKKIGEEEQAYESRKHLCNCFRAIADQLAKNLSHIEENSEEKLLLSEAESVQLRRCTLNTLESEQHNAERVLRSIMGCWGERMRLSQILKQLEVVHNLVEFDAMDEELSAYAYRMDNLRHIWNGIAEEKKEFLEQYRALDQWTNRVEHGITERDTDVLAIETLLIEIENQSEVIKTLRQSVTAEDQLKERTLLSALETRLQEQTNRLNSSKEWIERKTEEKRVSKHKRDTKFVELKTWLGNAKATVTSGQKAVHEGDANQVKQNLEQTKTTVAELDGQAAAFKCLKLDFAQNPDPSAPWWEFEQTERDLGTLRHGLNQNEQLLTKSTECWAIFRTVNMDDFEIWLNYAYERLGQLEKCSPETLSEAEQELEELRQQADVRLAEAEQLSKIMQCKHLHTMPANVFKRVGNCERRFRELNESMLTQKGQALEEKETFLNDLEQFETWCESSQETMATYDIAHIRQVTDYQALNDQIWAEAHLTWDPKSAEMSDRVEILNKKFALPDRLAITARFDRTCTLFADIRQMADRRRTFLLQLSDVLQEYRGCLELMAEITQDIDKMKAEDAEEAWDRLAYSNYMFEELVPLLPDLVQKQQWSRVELTQDDGSFLDLKSYICSAKPKLVEIQKKLSERQDFLDSVKQAARRVPQIEEWIEQTIEITTKIKTQTEYERLQAQRETVNRLAEEHQEMASFIDSLLQKLRSVNSLSFYALKERTAQLKTQLMIAKSLIKYAADPAS